MCTGLVFHIRYKNWLFQVLLTLISPTANSPQCFLKMYGLSTRKTMFMQWWNHRKNPTSDGNAFWVLKNQFRYSVSDQFTALFTFTVLMYDAGVQYNEEWNFSTVWLNSILPSKILDLASSFDLATGLLPILLNKWMLCKLSPVRCADIQTHISKV